MWPWRKHLRSAFRVWLKGYPDIWSVRDIRFLLGFRGAWRFVKSLSAGTSSGPSSIWTGVVGFFPFPWCLGKGKSLNYAQIGLRRPWLSVCTSDLLPLGGVWGVFFCGWSDHHIVSALPLLLCHFWGVCKKFLFWSCNNVYKQWNRESTFPSKIAHSLQLYNLLRHSLVFYKLSLLLKNLSLQKDHCLHRCCLCPPYKLRSSTWSTSSFYPTLVTTVMKIKNGLRCS